MVFSDLIALYLFLGGTAAGSFAVLSVIELCLALFPARGAHSDRSSLAWREARFRSAAQRRIAKIGYAISFGMLVVGLLCLLADLGRPEEFYLLFLYPTSSFVSIGTFALALFALCLALALAEAALTLGPVWKKAALVAKALGTILALLVMVYTGLLLENVIAVDLWRSAWLPLLFLFSALSCGCGVVLLSACFSEGSEGVLAWVRYLSIGDVAAIVLEAAALAACAVTVNSAGPGRPFDALLSGGQSAVFWLGFVGCGLVAPLVVEVFALSFRRGRRGFLVASLAVLLLVGGFSLRFALVGAGVQTAV